MNYFFVSLISISLTIVCAAQSIKVIENEDVFIFSNESDTISNIKHRLKVIQSLTCLFEKTPKFVFQVIFFIFKIERRFKKF